MMTRPFLEHDTDVKGNRWIPQSIDILRQLTAAAKQLCDRHSCRGDIEGYAKTVRLSFEQLESRQTPAVFTGGGASPSWFDGANWDTGVPANTDAVTIPAGKYVQIPNTGATAFARSIIVVSQSGRGDRTGLEVQSGGVLNMSMTAAFGGRTVIMSGGVIEVSTTASVTGRTTPGTRDGLYIASGGRLTVSQALTVSGSMEMSGGRVTGTRTVVNNVPQYANTAMTVSNNGEFAGWGEIVGSLDNQSARFRAGFLVGSNGRPVPGSVSRTLEVDTNFTNSGVVTFWVGLTQNTSMLVHGTANVGVGSVRLDRTSNLRRQREVTLLYADVQINEQFPNKIDFGRYQTRYTPNQAPVHQLDAVLPANVGVVRANALPYSGGQTQGQQLGYIYGTGFVQDDLAQVLVGDTPAPYFHVDSEQVISFLTPAGSGTGPVTIVRKSDETVVVTDPLTEEPIEFTYFPVSVGLFADQNPVSGPNATATLTAQLAEGEAVSAHFWDSVAGDLGTADFDETGKAVLTVSGLAPGIHHFSAVVNGSTVYSDDETGYCEGVVTLDPAFTSADEDTFVAGVNNSFTISTTGFPAAHFSISGDLPNGVDWYDNDDGTLTLSGIPELDSGGVYSFTITADNGIETASQSFTLTTLEAPTFFNDDSVSINVGLLGGVLVETNGYPTSITLSVSGALPSGVTFVDLGGGFADLMGIPEVGTEGTYTFTISADNGVGGVTNQSFTMEVLPPNAAVFNSMTVNGGAIYAIDTLGNTPALAGQNSVVAQLLVEFDSGVTLDSGAFTLDALAVTVNIAGTTTPMAAGFDVAGIIAEPVTASLDAINGGYTQYRLRFDVSSYTNLFDNTALGNGGIGNIFTTLKDGFYKLNIHGSRVRSGGTLDGVAADDSSVFFWTVFGCSDPSDMYLSANNGGSWGDGQSIVAVNASILDFGATNGSQSDQTAPPYDPRFDWNLDGFVTDDLIEFAKRFGLEWSF